MTSGSSPRLTLLGSSWILKIKITWENVSQFSPIHQESARNDLTGDYRGLEETSPQNLYR